MAALFVSATLCGAACSGDPARESEDGDDASAGDGATTGGDSGEGGEGASSSGGSGRGGASGRGGTGATGGTNETGGNAGAGGESGDTGETGGMGGGGATGSMSGAGSGNGGSGAGGGGGAGGGIGGTGGAGNGGVVGGSGAGGGAVSGAGGAGPVTCDSLFSVGADGFVRAPGVSGCWHGYPYAGGDTGSVVMPTTFAMCGAGCMLRLSGTLGPATAANNYSGVVYIGFNLNQAMGTTTPGTVTPTGTSLQVTYTKVSGPSIVRVQIQRGATRWCAELAGSPVNIPYASFNTACWDMSGTAYSKQPIEAIQLVVPGGAAAVPIDLTLVSVKDS